jgi:SanA protein
LILGCYFAAVRGKTYKVIRRLAALGVLGLSLLLVLYFWIKTESLPYLYSDLEKLPQTQIGLVLGTSKKLSNGESNPYFRNRMEAAARLYKSGRIKILIVSGDNRSAYYNEPRDMKEALMALGVPEHSIWLDYAGVRTLDSVLRCKRIFGYSRFVVISQQFHNERAVFLARRMELDAVGYNAQDVLGWAGLKIQLREFLARPLALWDLAGIMARG